MQFVESPKSRGFYQPAEWSPHESCWLAWPSHAELWQHGLKPAQQEFIRLCEAIVRIDPRTARARGESLDILVPDEKAMREAKTRLGHLPCRFHAIPFGDIWLRDTAPVFLIPRSGNEEVGKKGASVRFSFNGWGRKYVLPHDHELAARIAGEAGLKEFSLPFVLEGGAIESDGEGTLLTSRQCLLNPNRNAGMSREQIEAGICEAYGADKVLWVGDGLINDHTDGHIDTIARFVAPGVVMCMEARDGDDPNRASLLKIAAELESQTDAKGRRLRVIRIPSPGAIFNDDGAPMPASYLNFYIANSTVVVPTYGSRWDDEAVKAIGDWFPGRETLGCSALAILNGGGAFHCITQQQPRATRVGGKEG